jgi:cyclic beta-1,2-glucan synthetase
LKNDIQFRQPGKFTFAINKILYDRETILKYAKSLSYDLRFFEIKKNPVKYLPSLNTNAFLIKRMFLGCKRINSEGTKDGICEWILDNYYLIEEQIKTEKMELENLKTCKYPILKNNVFRGYPRTFTLASEFIAHRQGAFDESLFYEFIEAFQINEPLSMKEVYALPTMLRAALINYLSQISSAQLYRFKIKKEANRILKLFNKNDDNKEFLVEIYKQAFNTILVDGGFLEEFNMLIGEKGEKEKGYKEFLRCLKRKDINLKKEIEESQAVKTKNQIMLSNIINSIRTISNISWEGFLEKACTVNQILSKDEIYRSMDFESKEYYRKNIEKIAISFDVPEISIAKKAIELYEKNKKHIGFYLLEKEKDELTYEFSDKQNKKFNEKKKRFLAYMLSIFVPAVSFSVLAGIVVFKNGYGVISIFTAFIASLIPLTTLCASVINRIFMKYFDNGFIPRLSYDKVTQAKENTMVITPCLVIDKKTLDDQILGIEVNYLANKLSNISFALVADFKQSNKILSDAEKNLIDYGKSKIVKLNRKYGNEVFYFYARRRIKKDNAYVAYERKRGAVLDVCKMLYEKKTDSFYIEKSNIPESIDFILTIDSDTQILRESAAKLIGAMLHPLNKPILSKDGKHVESGYGLITPTVGVDIEQAAKSKLAFSFAGSPGLDSYSACASNVYQDVFNEGIFAGKAIFDLKTYILVLEGAFEDERVLSHDFLEGHYLRTGLSSDVVFMDGYPKNYISWAQRQHRWTRGDWQHLAWLKGTVKNKEKEIYSNPIDNLGKYQIIDNLRRSALPIFAAIVIILGLTIFKKLPFFLFLVGFTPYFFEPIISLIVNLINLVKNRKKGATLIDAFLETKDAFFESFYKFSFLLFEAYLMLDAIFRTLYRMIISKKNLLEWKTADESEKENKQSKRYFYKKMWISPLLAIIVLIIYIILGGSFKLWLVLMILVWIVAPYIAYFISEEIKQKKINIGSYEYKELNLLARKTYLYFEDLCKHEHYYWAPDNFQEYPKKEPVYRTSPTNVGFSLTAFYSGYVFGYIPYFHMIDKVSRIIEGIEKAEKWEGHLYNWYDLEKNIALSPKYISAVDSGNLACYLVLMIEALESSLDEPLYQNSLEGVYFSLASQMDGIDDKILNSLREKVDGSTITTFDLLNQLYGLDKILPKYISNYQNSDIKRTIDLYINEINEYFTYVDMLQNYYIKEEYSVKSLETIKNGIGYISLNNLITEQARQIKGLSRLKRMTDLEYDSNKLLNFIKESNTKLMVKRNEILVLKRRMEVLLDKMNFCALYNSKKDLFSIGYDYEHKKMSESYYDLLASEARQTAFIAIAKGDVPTKHWFKLMRPVGINQEKRVLLSWSGTMFEYLMPLIIMKNYKETLMDETYDAVMDIQIGYGKKRNTPWGVSESGYYAFDFDMFYQYKAFGVPKLGLKFSDENNLVVSPYSSCLGLMVNPNESLKNYKMLKAMNVVSRYGLYEAVDFVHGNKGNIKYSIVKSYMAHHQGMILSALTNYFYEGKLQNTFHSSKMVMATQSILKEKSVPRNLVIEDFNKSIQPKANGLQELYTQKTKYTVTGEETPKAHVLSNGNYSCMLTQLGTGFSKYKDLLLNQWSNDYMRVNSGNFIFINDKFHDKSWSMGYLPSDKKPDSYNAVFLDYKASFLRKDDFVTSKMDVCISPEINIELRKITLTNSDDKIKSFEIASVIKPMLSSIQDYISHPAFSSLFIERIKTEDKNLLIIKKRSRDENIDLYLGLKCISPLNTAVTRQINLDKIFKRLNCAKNFNFRFNEDLNAGAKIALAIKTEVKIMQHSEEQICFITSASESLEELRENLDSINEISQANAVFELAKTAALVKQEYDTTTSQEKEMFNKILSSVIFNLSQSEKQKIEYNTFKKERLFRYGLNEKQPYILVFIKTASDLKRIKLLIKSFDFFRHESIPINLVIVDRQQEVYYSSLKDKVNEYIGRYAKEGRYYVKTKAVYIAAEYAEKGDIDGIISCANLVLDASKSILDQLVEPENDNNIKFFKRNYSKLSDIEHFKSKEKSFNNGYGGFVNNGEEYTIISSEDETLPAPWVNILANKNFGSVISSEGGGYTWAYNARLFRITPFRNQGFDDIPSEGLYLRDDEYGYVKNLMPIKDSKGSYNITHGKGYSIFENNNILNTKLCVFVCSEIKAKVYSINIENLTDEEKEFSMFYYLEPVLAEDNFWCKNIVTKNLEDNALTAQNLLDTGEFNGKAYITCLAENYEFTSDKKEVFGAFGAGNTPYMFKKEKLNNKTGKFSETCLVIKVKKHIKPNQKIRINFVCGFEETDKQILNTIDILKTEGGIDAEFSVVNKNYNDICNSIQVKTPKKSFDYMMNGWLIYQTYNSRLLSRTGYFQSGGGYGFRDQLQDVLSILYTKPFLVKEQILRCAKRQFIEGDVLHWWHQKAKGVRTHISDDLLFLPYVLSEYISATNDYNILNMKVSYLKSQDIPDNKEDLYGEFEESEIVENIYTHSLKAILHAYNLGSHGLALIKGGDWNDGMNRVGKNGKGESVWLSMFLYDVLIKFSKISKHMKEIKTENMLILYAEDIKKSIEESAWDGSWYMRGFYDNGDPLGSKESDECKIDLISQSWATISGACDNKRCETSFNSAYNMLLEEEAGIIKLLDPPFRDSKNNPGYIKSYVKGVRENGGQYTHAAAWYIISAAILNKNNIAFKMFDMINPINLTSTKQGVLKYKAEPYAVAGDVYSEAEKGRAGWTWYTGSACWLYRAGLEHILGFKKQGDRIYIKPCIPDDWDEFIIIYKYNKSEYNIEVKSKYFNDGSYKKIIFDGVMLTEDYIPIIDDNKKHIACVILS